ncbi:MAG: UvrD-helicase domain-containing protein, partial [Candidatus Dadabacteria bacterium]|nr:UvrD-helicase domain-containing protein [Candidatus Dadabacteria bacterium]
MTSGIKDKLNPSQAEAVTHAGGPVLVLAGAGSGKTRIITERIAYLIEMRGENPANILAVTFTNKAANEMKERLYRLIGPATKSLWLGTFHSICLRILKREIKHLSGFRQDFIIYDDGDQLKLIKECMEWLNIGEKELDPRSVRSKIDGAKNKGLDPGEAGRDTYDERVSKIYALYEQELRKLNALDFGDLLYVTVRLFREKPDVLHHYQEAFRHILVDEYQDTNHMQYKIVELLSRKHRDIFVVGDDNQSIYGWRGADITNILNFERDYPDSRVIKLEKNYRSTKTILSAANGLIRKNSNRHDKNLWTENPEGDKLQYYAAHDERDEARYVVSQIESLVLKHACKYKDAAVFYRTNNQSRIMEEELVRKGIPYTIVGGIGFYQRAEIKDIMAYLRVIANPLDDLSLRRIANVPPRGIGRGTMERLDEIARNEGISLMDAMQKAVGDNVMPARAALNLGKFLDLMKRLIGYGEKYEIGKLLDLVLQETRYLDILEREEEKRENVGEILNLAAEFEKESEKAWLRDFLDTLTLASDVDSYDEKDDRVALMTLHSAKGLEFPLAFIIGLEENLIPHFNSARDGQVEEERRLFYVGLTRAKEMIHLTSAARRRVFGKEERPVPSRFITDIPKELIELKNYYGTSYGGFGARDYPVEKSARAEGPRQSRSAGNGGRYKAGQRIEHPSFGQGTIK